MKQLIKTITPKPVLNIARELRDWPRLKAVPAQIFNPSPLRTAADIDLSDIFKHKDTESKWDEDHAAITKLFGDENKMGGVNPGDRRAIYYLITALKPKNTLEIGTHIGASTLYISRALKKSAQKSKITSVDIFDINDLETGPWKQAGLSHPPKDLAAQLDCADIIDFHTAPCLDMMRATKKHYDFIFLDGDHTAQAVYQEVSAALSLLEKNGVILLHDYYPEAKPLFPDGNIISGPFRALQRIKKENSAIDVLPLSTLPWPTKQGTNVTSLALVVKKT